MVRQGLLPRRGTTELVRNVPYECRDCPQGKKIAKEEKLIAKQKTYIGDAFRCGKCGEGEKEGRRHAARGLCKKCYTAESKRGTIEKWPATAAAVQEKSVVLDSPITTIRAAQEEAAAPSAEAEKALDPVRITELGDIVLRFDTPRNQHLRHMLDLMAIVNRRELIEEVFINLEYASNTFLEHNPVLKDPDKKQKFLEKVNI